MRINVGLDLDAEVELVGRGDRVFARLKGALISAFGRTRDEALDKLRAAIVADATAYLRRDPGMTARRGQPSIDDIFGEAGDFLDGIRTEERAGREFRDLLQTRMTDLVMRYVRMAGAPKGPTIESLADEIEEADFGDSHVCREVAKYLRLRAADTNTIEKAAASYAAELDAQDRGSATEGDLQSPAAWRIALESKLRTFGRELSNFCNKDCAQEFVDAFQGIVPAPSYRGRCPWCGSIIGSPGVGAQRGPQLPSKEPGAFVRDALDIELLPPDAPKR